MTLSFSLEQYMLGSQMIKGNYNLNSDSLLAVLGGNASMFISPVGGVDALLTRLRASKVLGR